jgi:hypothetical protein
MTIGDTLARASDETCCGLTEVKRHYPLYDCSSDSTHNQVCYAPNDNISNEHYQKINYSNKSQNEKDRNQHYGYCAYDPFFVTNLLRCIFGFGHNSHIQLQMHMLPKKHFKLKNK